MAEHFFRHRQAPSMFGQIDPTELDEFRQILSGTTADVMSQVLGVQKIKQEKEIQEIISPVLSGSSATQLGAMVRLLQSDNPLKGRVFDALGQIYDRTLAQEKFLKEQQKIKPITPVVRSLKQPVDGKPHDFLVFVDPETKREIDRVDLGEAFVTPKAGQDPKVRRQRLEKENFQLRLKLGEIEAQIGTKREVRAGLKKYTQKTAQFLIDAIEDRASANEQELATLAKPIRARIPQGTKRLQILESIGQQIEGRPISRSKLNQLIQKAELNPNDPDVIEFFNQ